MLKSAFVSVAALIALVSASGSFASPAVGSRPPLTLTPQTQVTVRTDDGFRVTYVRPASGAPEARAPSRTATTDHMTTLPGRVSFGAAPGTVRFTLWANPSYGAHLKVENNTGRALIYSARIVTASAPRGIATTICSVRQGTVGYESWPDTISAIIITGFYPAPANAQVCGYPERGQIGAPPPSEQPTSGK